mgnify:CR=1 FL=1
MSGVGTKGLRAVEKKQQKKYNPDSFTDGAQMNPSEKATPDYSGTPAPQMQQLPYDDDWDDDLYEEEDDEEESWQPQPYSEPVSRKEQKRAAKQEKARRRQEKKTAERDEPRGRPLIVKALLTVFVLVFAGTAIVEATERFSGWLAGAAVYLAAMALVVLVVFLFLRNGRATSIPAVAAPVSLIGTFGVMYLCGYTLDNLSLMALTVATGFVVDDAIVVLENIVRRLEMGEKPLRAALRGAREVGFTVISISLSLVAVFIPILFMGGVVGRLFREFSVVLATAVLVSMVVSLTTTPMMLSLIHI